MINKNKGFTLIELLIVVSLIGVLSGILLTVINVTRVKGTARDGVRQANMTKLVTGLEAFYVSEGRYPTAGNSGTEDLDTSSNPYTLNTDAIQTYITVWPEGVNDDGTSDADYGYLYSTSSGAFTLSTLNSLGGCYKYHSDWKEVRNCALVGGVCPTGTTCTEL